MGMATWNEMTSLLKEKLKVKHFLLILFIAEYSAQYFVLFHRLV